MDNSRQLPGSIRNRILIFSLLVTLVPSIGMGWFWYDISRETTTAKTAQQLATSADIIEREIGLWFKERNYDLRVLANSFVIAENLAVYRQAVENGTTAAEAPAEAVKKISTYLSIIITKFINYHHLAVLDAGGKVIAASSPLEQEKFMVLPANWSEQVSRAQYFIGDYFFATPEGDPLVLMGIPLLESGDDQIVGFFVLEAHLDTIQSLFLSSLAGSGMQTGSAITLLERDGRVIARTTANPDAEQTDVVAPEALQLLEQPQVLQEYVTSGQEAVLAMVFPLAHLPWYLLLEEDRKKVYAGLMDARDQILLITALLTIVIGGTAIIIARHIIIPLQELTTGVQQVAGGDLQVAIPVHRKDELGLVATMFNEMVQRLQEGQTRLEELATTDPLTGLANRKQIMAELELQMDGFRRHATSFAVLMLDIDFFKKVNDNHGHQAGDSVLIGMANVLGAILRSLDTAGRYGGEEFLVILDTTDQMQALQTAERIRHAVEKHVFPWRPGEDLHVTVSIGTGAILSSDESVDTLITRVDRALYSAKAEGRNRVCLAEPDESLQNAN